MQDYSFPEIRFLYLPARKSYSQKVWFSRRRGLTFYLRGLDNLRLTQL